MIGTGYLLITALVWATIIALSWGLSKYLKKVYKNEKTFLDKLLNPFENVIYRILGIDRDKGMDWKEYFLSLFMFSVFTVAISFIVLTFQGMLPLNPMKFHGMSWSLAFNTAMSISSNTNLQHYNGGSTLSYLGQMVGIQFLQFTSAASGIAVAVAIFRGFAGKRGGDRNLGNFYTDMVRTMTRVLLPLTLLLSLILIGLGVPQSLSGYSLVRTLSGSFELIKVGPVSSLVSIMQLGTNGGGYYGANSAYPFQNPNPLTNYIELGAMMLIPTSMLFLFGLMLDKKGEGRTILIASYGLYAIDLAIALIPNTGLGPGMETRFGGFSPVLYTVTTTAFTTGSVNTALAAMHPLVILAAFLGMMIQATPGGAGVGAMYMLMYVMITVFIVGLMAGRTPEYLGAKISAKDVELAIVAFLSHPIIILVPTVLAYALGAVHAIGLGNGPGGFTEILYEYTSAAANNGSDFLGSSGNTVFFNVSTGIVMWAGRFIPILIMLAISGRMYDKKRSPEVALRTDDLIFPAILIFSIIILAVLTFFPFLAVGPILMHLEGIGNAL